MSVIQHGANSAKAECAGPYLSLPVLSIYGARRYNINVAPEYLKRRCRNRISPCSFTTLGTNCLSHHYIGEVQMGQGLLPEIAMQQDDNTCLDTNTENSLMQVFCKAMSWSSILLPQPSRFTVPMLSFHTVCYHSTCPRQLWCV